MTRTQTRPLAGREQNKRGTPGPVYAFAPRLCPSPQFPACTCVVYTPSPTVRSLPCIADDSKDSDEGRETLGDDSKGQLGDSKAKCEPKRGDRKRTQEEKRQDKNTSTTYLIAVFLCFRSHIAVDPDADAVAKT